MLVMLEGTSVVRGANDNSDCLRVQFLIRAAISGRAKYHHHLEFKGKDPALLFALRCLLPLDLRQLPFNSVAFKPAEIKNVGAAS